MFLVFTEKWLFVSKSVSLFTFTEKIEFDFFVILSSFTENSCSLMKKCVFPRTISWSRRNFESLRFLEFSFNKCQNRGLRQFYEIFLDFRVISSREMRFHVKTTILCTSAILRNLPRLDIQQLSATLFSRNLFLF